MTKFRKILSIMMICGVALVGVRHVHASLVPTLTLTINSNNTIQATVFGADPNVAVLLYYPSSSSVATSNIGNTNASGYLSVALSQSTYNINPGAMVYAFVDGQQSQQIAWPNVSTSVSGSLSLNMTNVTIPVGQSSVITALNGSGFVVSNNVSPSVAAGLIVNGNQVNITAYSPGTTNMTLCSSSNGCATITVTVIASSNGTPAGTALSFPASEEDLNVGQSVSVPITGSGSYLITNNTNQGVVLASLNNGALTLIGQSFGSSNVTVCLSDNSQCVTLYVYVSPSNGAPPAQTQVVASTVPTFAPAMTSFMVSSNNTNNTFSRAGDTISISFTTNQVVVNPTATIAGANISLSGSNNGPYAGSYHVTGNENQPIAVNLSFANSANMTGNAHFTIADQASVANTASAISSVSSLPSASGGATFTLYLKLNSTGSEVSALQSQLKKDGLYSGPITGTFGSLTEAAVKKYQSKHGLNTLGAVGPATRALLNQGI